MEIGVRVQKFTDFTQFSLLYVYTEFDDAGTVCFPIRQIKTIFRNTYP